MTALVAVDACESLMQIDAGQETLEDLGLDRPVDQPGVVELNCVVPNALIQRARPRVAWAVDSAPGHHFLALSKYPRSYSKKLNRRLHDTLYG